jgi:dimethylsulfone monooxygenase
MDFGVRLTIMGEMGAPGTQIADYAMKMGIRADELGYASAWIPDHVNNARVGNFDKGPCLESWTAMTAILMQTKNIIMGPHVFANHFRHPSLLALMVSTLDQFSRGRVILSFGGGWFEKEAVTLGFPWSPDHDERMEQTREAYQIIKALWTQDEVTFKGKYYNLEKGYQLPRPYSQPHPPIWVPGESRIAREMMKELGDTWLIYSKNPETVARMKKEMSEFCGREIKLAVSAVFVSGLPEKETTAFAQKFVGEREHRFKVKPTLELALDSNLIGTLDYCRERVQAYKEAGVDHLIIQPMPPYEGMELFAKEIMSGFMDRK